jgi:hypothetical protein
MSQPQEEPKELTIEEIENLQVHEKSLFNELFKTGAIWAKELSDTYWKARLIEEVGLAFEAGKNRGFYDGHSIDAYEIPDEDQYI